jgi:cysteine desulfurase
LRRRPKVEIEAQIHGGGLERGMRSGTLATHQVVGMGEACAVAAAEMAVESDRILLLRNHFLKRVGSLEGVSVNGDRERRLPGNLNLSFAGVDGESLLLALKDLAVSSGSACTSASLEPSYVLRELGLDDELAHSSLRFSFGRYTTAEEVDHAAELIVEALARLRGQAPAPALNPAAS